MSAKELVHLAEAEGLLSDKRFGKTPHQTMKSKLSQEIRKNGSRSLFVRTKPGRFYLRELLDEGTSIHTSPQPQARSSLTLDELPFEDLQSPKVSKTYDAPALARKKPAELVLGFPGDWLDEVGRFQGVAKSWRRLYGKLLQGPIRAMDRFEAESSENFKQLLTYILVTHHSSILEFRRGHFSRADTSLRGSRCIGFGGHITASDRTLFGKDPLGVLESAARELSEELVIPVEEQGRVASADGLEVVGMLNDDSSPLGRRHFAIVLEYKVDNFEAWERPAGKEKSVTQVRWLNPAIEDLNLWEFEYWSQLCLRHFFRPSNSTEASYRVIRKQPLRPPHLLCVVGQIGSGKTETTSVLVDDFGYDEINTGRLVAKMMGSRLYNDRTRKGFQEKAWRFINKPGSPTRLAAQIVKEAKSISNPRVLIDGIRQVETLNELRAQASAAGLKVAILYMHTPPDLAYSFFRARSGKPTTLDEFLAIREAPVEAEVPHFLAQADAILYNWSGKLSFRRAIHELMETLGVSPSTMDPSR